MELVAALLSALLPGLGQLYLGERSNGLSLIAASLGMLLVLSYDLAFIMAKSANS